VQVKQVAKNLMYNLMSDFDKPELSEKLIKKVHP
jgi:hypothetical protein